MKAFVSGLLGALIGVVITCAAIKAGPFGMFLGYDLFELSLVSEHIGIILLMPLYNVGASFLPSFIALQNDPAEVLIHE